jgi:alpha-glucosidase
VERYRQAPEFKFMKDIPAAWDETRVIDGAVGDYIVIARRKGEEWFIGAATDWTPRELEIPLGFLGAGAYSAEIYADAADAEANPTKVVMSKQDVTNSAMLKATLAPGGGYAVRFSKK